MTQADISALLGRPLTAVETTNFNLYLEIATDTVEGLICSDLSSETEARTFDVRDGYKTVFTDPFTDVQSVEHDGETLDVSEYSVRQWDKRNGEWYNSIVLSSYKRGYVTITADWGFECYPKDLQRLIANAFSSVSKKNTSNSSVANKQVEDFRVSYRTDTSLEDLFIEDNAATIKKYSLCSVGHLRHGETCDDREC